MMFQTLIRISMDNNQENISEETRKEYKEFYKNIDKIAERMSEVLNAYYNYDKNLQKELVMPKNILEIIHDIYHYIQELNNANNLRTTINSPKVPGWINILFSFSLEKRKGKVTLRDSKEEYGYLMKFIEYFTVVETDDQIDNDFFYFKDKSIGSNRNELDFVKLMIWKCINYLPQKEEQRQNLTDPQKKTLIQSDFSKKFSFTYFNLNKKTKYFLDSLDDNNILKDAESKIKELINFVEEKKQEMINKIEKHTGTLANELDNKAIELTNEIETQGKEKNIEKNDIEKYLEEIKQLTTEKIEELNKKKDSLIEEVNKITSEDELTEKKQDEFQDTLTQLKETSKQNLDNKANDIKNSIKKLDLKPNPKPIGDSSDPKPNPKPIGDSSDPKPFPWRTLVVVFLILGILLSLLFYYLWKQKQNNSEEEEEEENIDDIISNSSDDKSSDISSESDENLEDTSDDFDYFE